LLSCDRVIGLESMAVRYGLIGSTGSARNGNYYGVGLADIDLRRYRGSVRLF